MNAPHALNPFITWSLYPAKNGLFTPSDFGQRPAAPTVSKDTNLKNIKNHVKKNGDSQYLGMDYSGDYEPFDLDNYLYHCCRILKTSCSIIVWASWQQLKTVDDIIRKYLNKEKGEPRIGIWRKTNPAIFNMDKIALQPYEFFVWNRKGENTIFNNQNGKYFDSRKTVRQHAEIHFYDCSAPRGIHENAKPVEIFEWLIYTYTNEINEVNEKSIVFDGCMGSGTTAIAAIKTRRNFIGFEINKRYYKHAQERIKYYLKQFKKEETM